MHYYDVPTYYAREYIFTTAEQILVTITDTRYVLRSDHHAFIAIIKTYRVTKHVGTFRKQAFLLSSRSESSRGNDPNSVFHVNFPETNYLIPAQISC